MLLPRIVVLVDLVQVRSRLVIASLQDVEPLAARLVSDRPARVRHAGLNELLHLAGLYLDLHEYRNHDYSCYASSPTPLGAPTVNLRQAAYR